MRARLVVLPTSNPADPSRRFGAGLKGEGQAFDLLSFGATEHEAEVNAVAALAYAILKEYAVADAVAWATAWADALGKMRDRLHIAPNILAAAATRADRMADGGGDTAALAFDASDRQELTRADRRWRDTAAALRAVTAATPGTHPGKPRC